MKEITLTFSACDDAMICIGKQGENKACRVRIDCREPLDGLHAVSGVVKVKNADGDAYVAQTTMHDGFLEWVVSDTDTATAGMGQAQIELLGQDEEVLKTAIMQVGVLASLAASDNPPQPVQDWLDEAADTLQALVRSIELAENGAHAANNAAESVNALTIAITMLPTDSGATVTVSEEDGHKHLVLGIPKGDTGARGPQGPPGEGRVNSVDGILSGNGGNVSLGAVRYTQGQALTEAQKAQARSNIGATASLRQNLLDNWDFRKPVNQRNISAFTAGKYGLDRWLLQSGSCSVNSGYIALGPSSILVQRFEHWTLDNQPICLSVMLPDGNIKSGSVIPNASENKSVVVDNLRLGLYNGAACKEIRITELSGAVVNITAVKVELGTNSTLAQDAPANFGEQMLRCQRYCRIISSGNMQPCIIVSANTAQAVFPIGASMRENPSIGTLDPSIGTINDAFTVYSTSTGTEVSGFTFSANFQRPDFIRISGSKTGHGLQNASIRATTDILLFAEL